MLGVLQLAWASHLSCGVCGGGSSGLPSGPSSAAAAQACLECAHALLLGLGALGAGDRAALLELRLPPLPVRQQLGILHMHLQGEFLVSRAVFEMQSMMVLRGLSAALMVFFKGSGISY